MNNYHSNYLFASSGFLIGAAFAFDIGSTLVEYNASLTPEYADSIAIHNDWKAVGKDLRDSINESKKQKK